MVAWLFWGPNYELVRIIVEGPLRHCTSYRDIVLKSPGTPGVVRGGAGGGACHGGVLVYVASCWCNMLWCMSHDMVQVRAEQLGGCGRGDLAGRGRRADVTWPCEFHAST